MPQPASSKPSRTTTTTPSTTTTRNQRHSQHTSDLIVPHPSTNSQSMPLPRNWSVLSFDNTDKRFYLGVNYDDGVLKDHHEFTCGYSIFITDFSYVWHCDVDRRRLVADATSIGYDASSVNQVYKQLAMSFSSMFQDADTSLKLDEKRIDHAVGLELCIIMNKKLEEHMGSFTWEFQLNRLPESTTIGIIHNLFYLESTVSFGMMQYQRALVKELERKDNLIRILMEKMSADTQVIVNNGSNKKASMRFDSAAYESEWKSKVLPTFSKKDIWDMFLTTNVASNTASFASLFVEGNLIKAESKKRSYEPQNLVKNEEDIKIPMIDQSPRKKFKPNVEDLQGSFKEELKLDTETTNLQPEEQDLKPSTPSPKKEKKRAPSGFGVSQKRKAYQEHYSPIKAARH